MRDQSLVIYEANISSVGKLSFFSLFPRKVIASRNRSRKIAPEISNRVWIMRIGREDLASLRKYAVLGPMSVASPMLGKVAVISHPVVGMGLISASCTQYNLLRRQSCWGMVKTVYTS
jgi:hypothetical protein